MLFGRKQKELEDKCRAHEEELNRVYQERKLLTDRVTELGDRLSSVLDHEASGTSCIEALLRRKIGWYDFDKLDDQSKMIYKNNAIAALHNDTVMNEMQHLIADWVEEIAKRAKSYDEVNDLRMCINALEMFRERLEGIPDPRQSLQQEEPYSAV